MENNKQRMEEDLSADDVYEEALSASKDIEDELERCDAMLNVLSTALEKSVGVRDFNWWTDEEIELSKLVDEYYDIAIGMQIEKAKAEGTYKRPRITWDTGGRNHI